MKDDGNVIHTVRATDAEKVITVRIAFVAFSGEGGLAAVEIVSAASGSGVYPRQARIVGIPPSGTDLCQDHDLGRPCTLLLGKVPGSHPAGSRK